MRARRLLAGAGRWPRIWRRGPIERGMRRTALRRGIGPGRHRGEKGGKEGADIGAGGQVGDRSAEDFGAGGGDEKAPRSGGLPRPVNPPGKGDDYGGAPPPRSTR